MHCHIAGCKQHEYIWRNFLESCLTFCLWHKLCVCVSFGVWRHFVGLWLFSFVWFSFHVLIVLMILPFLLRAWESLFSICLSDNHSDVLPCWSRWQVFCLLPWNRFFKQGMGVFFILCIQSRSPYMVGWLTGFWLACVNKFLKQIIAIWWIAVIFCMYNQHQE